VFGVKGSREIDFNTFLHLLGSFADPARPAVNTSRTAG
jgi:hypothetical protein